MSNSRYLLAAIIILLFANCKPSALNFKEEQQLGKQLFANIPELTGNKSLVIDSVTVFRARLEEQVIDRNDVSEYKLVNDKSRKSYAVDFPIAGNYQHLYLFVLHTNPASDLCIYLSTGFDVEDRCTNAGPAFIGKIRMNQINFFKSLSVRETKGIYGFEKSRAKTILHFYLDSAELKKEVPNLKVYQVIRHVPNRISGQKPVIMNINRIFNDPEALFFSYETTYK